MQVRTYLAPTKLEALLKMREELGPGAVILSERVVRKGGLFRRKPMFEIVAGLEEPQASTPDQNRSRRSHLADPERATERGGVEPKGVEQYDPVQGRIRQLEREMQEMRSLVQMMYAQLMGEELPTSPTALANIEEEHPLMRPLLKAGVESEIARDVLRRVPRLPANAAIDALQRTLTARIPIGGAIPREARTRQIVALVGPTGVGKTTTIAKLAAIHALDYNRQVALLSLDTYRIGAIEQLRTYAGIMNLPLHVATTAEEAQEGLELCRACDLVLIDTVGRSQRDEAHLHELHAALAPLQPQVYLVLSATTDTAALENRSSGSASSNPRRLSSRKWTRRCGSATVSISACAIRCPSPISPRGSVCPKIFASRMPIGWRVNCSKGLPATPLPTPLNRREGESGIIGVCAGVAQG
jgi:flagellar biosynthesis protein FlhF